MTVVARALVSTAPQLLKPELNPAYGGLVNGLQAVEVDFKKLGVERIVYWSTQWISVLGQMFQAGSDLTGTHVDENWHESCELPFHFRVDQKLAAELCAGAAKAGFPGQCIDYRDFPVDTATIIADRFLNPDKIPVTMVACNVYCDNEKTKFLASELFKILEARKEKIAIVAVSLLSTSYHTSTIDLREDAIRGDEENAFVANFVRAVSSADWITLSKTIAHDGAKIRTDMGLKALSWLEGTMPAGRFSQPWNVLVTGPLYGASGIVAQL